MFRKAMIILSVAALSACTGTSEQGLDKMQQMMSRSPELRREANTECIEDIGQQSRAKRESMGRIMNVGLSQVPATFCRRVLAAVAAGRLKHSDLQSAVKGQATPNALRILKGQG